MWVEPWVKQKSFLWNLKCYILISLNVRIQLLPTKWLWKVSVSTPGKLDPQWNVFYLPLLPTRAVPTLGTMTVICIRLSWLCWGFLPETCSCWLLRIVVQVHMKTPLETIHTKSRTESFFKKKARISRCGSTLAVSAEIYDYISLNVNVEYWM